MTPAEQFFFSKNPNWTGSSTINEEVSLDFSVAFTIEGEQVQGTISIPVQNAYDIPLEDVALEEGTLYFTLKPKGLPKMMWAKYSFEQATESS